MECRMGWEIPAVVLGCAVTCGMITITNGIKPLVAFLVAAAVSRDRRLRKWLWPLFGAMTVVGVAGIVFFYVRALISGKDVVDCIQRTIVWVPEERMWGQELYDFFVRPIGVWQSCVVNAFKPPVTTSSSAVTPTVPLRATSAFTSFSYSWAL